MLIVILIILLLVCGVGGYRMGGPYTYGAGGLGLIILLLIIYLLLFAGGGSHLNLR